MTTFEDPCEFLQHLETAIAQAPSDQYLALLHASAHTIRWLIDSQTVVSDRLAQAVHVLNDHHASWGHKLSELYQVLQAADVDVDTMNQILLKEVCNHGRDKTG